MARQYTNLFELSTDFTLYLNMRTGSPYNLAQFQAVAKNRFTWFVDNWSSLYPRFVEMSNGDQSVESALVEFDRAIQTYALGSRLNPLENNENFILFYPFISQILLTELRLTPEETNYINTEIDRVRKFTTTDLRGMVNFIREQTALAAALLGKGDPDGLKIYGLSPVKKQRNPTFDDFLQIERAIELQKIIEGVIFDLRQQEDKPPNLLEISNSNIDTNSPVSVNTSYLSYTSVPFSGSLESMAQTYLGSKDRWYELVTVNNLQPPYIDEVGEKFPLVSPGGKNSVTIEGTRSIDIPVGQKIRVGSLKFKEEPRIIERKIENGDGTITLYLSGIQNLTLLKPQEQAYVRILKPHTVNTGSFILIPSDVRSSISKTTTPGSDALRRLDKALLSFGIDFKRNLSTGDIVSDASGNWEYVAGIDNIRQAVYYALRTEQGELPFHVNSYGITFNIGSVWLGSVEEAAVFADSLKSSLLRDRRFSSIKNLSIKVTGNSIALEMIVYIMGSNVPIPLSFVV